MLRELGYKVPADLGKELREHAFADEHTGMEYGLYKAARGGAYLGWCHDAVGLMSWAHVGSVDEGVRWLDQVRAAQVAICPDCAAGKCGACIGRAWSPAADDEVACSCTHEGVRA